MKKRRGAETKTSRRAKAPLRCSSRRRVSPAGSPPLLLPADWLLSFTLVPLISHCLWGRPGECSCLQCDPDLCRANNLSVTVIVKRSLLFLLLFFVCAFARWPQPACFAITPPMPSCLCPPSPSHSPTQLSKCDIIFSNSHILLDCVFFFFFLLASCVLHVRLRCYWRWLAQWHSHVFCVCVCIWSSGGCCFITACLRCRSVSLWQVVAHKLFSRRFSSKIFNQQSDEVKCNYLPWQLQPSLHP